MSRLHTESLSPVAMISALLLLGGCYVSHPGTPSDGAIDPDADMDTGIDFDTGIDSGVDATPTDSTVDSDRPPDVSPPDSGPTDSGMDAPPDSGVDGGDTGPVDSAVDSAVDAGRPSRALRFRPDQYLFVAPAVTLDLTTSQTYELWLRPRGDGPVMRKGIYVAGELIHFLVAVEGGQVVVGWGTEVGTSFLAAPIAMDVWTHVSVVLDVDPMLVTMRLHVDGAEVTTGLFRNTLVEALNDQPLLFGDGFTGDIDEVRIFTFARTEAAIRSTMFRRLLPAPAGMTAYWPMEESGQIVIDRTLRGNEGVLGEFTFRDPADPRWINDGPIP